MKYKVFRIEEPAAWGFTTHILAGKSIEDIQEELNKDIIDILDDDIPSIRAFWKSAYVDYLGESDTPNINPSEWAWKGSKARIVF